jgi:hypothetical protein
MYSKPVYYDMSGDQISQERHEQRAVLDKVPVFFDDVNGVGVETRFYGVDFDHVQTPMLFTTSIVDPTQPERHEWQNHVITYTQSSTYASAQGAHEEAVRRLSTGVAVFNDPDDDKVLAEMQERVKSFALGMDETEQRDVGLYDNISQVVRERASTIPGAVQQEVRAEIQHDIDLSGVNGDERRIAAERQTQMDQGPPRDQAVPYKREIIGEYVLQAPAVKKGRDGVDYTIPAGPQSIVGAVSLDGYKLHDAAIVYDPKLLSKETGKPIYLPEPLHVPQLADAQKKGLVKIHEPHQHKVDEAIERARKASESVQLAAPGTVEALARDWHNIQDRQAADLTRPVAIAGNSLIVEVQKGAKFGAPEMKRALDSLGREDVDRVAVRIVERAAHVREITTANVVPLQKKQAAGIGMKR